MDQQDDDPSAPADGEACGPSLLEDVGALVEDGKVYLEAELAFQKSRAGFVGDRIKSVAIFGGLALGLLHLALIALTVGAVLTLAPLFGPLLATIAVVAVLLVLAALLLVLMRGKLREIGEAFEEPEQ